MRETEITSIESGGFDGLTSLQSLFLGDNHITSIGPNAFAGLTNLETMELWNNDFTELNLSGATFENLQPFVVIPIESGLVSGLAIDDSITSLVLDDADLSQSSFVALVDAVAEQTSIIEVSLVNLIFTDQHPNDLSAVLGIPSLDNVRIDPSLFNRYADELNAFDAMAGNAVTVVPEPSSIMLLMLLSVLWLKRRRGN